MNEPTSASQKLQLQTEQENVLPSMLGKVPLISVQPLQRNALKDIRNEGEKSGCSSSKVKDEEVKKLTSIQTAKSPFAGISDGFKKPTKLPAKFFNTPRCEEPQAASLCLEIPEVESSKKQIIDVDAQDARDAQLMSNYVKNVYKYLQELEVKYEIKPDFMNNMMIHPAMRSILIDWLVDVHLKFKLLPETLYLNVAIMDRFLQEDRTVKRGELQLVGLGALFIASKYEEIHAPDVRDLIYMSDNSYTVRELLRMELRILKKLDFSLGRPFPLQFLRRYTKVASTVMDNFDVLHHTLAKYLMELTLPEYSFCHYLPSELAAAALCLSLYVLDTSGSSFEQLWTDVMVHYSSYTVEAIHPLMQRLACLVLKADSSKFQAIRKKYSSSKFYNISTISQLQGARLVALAEQR